MATQYTTFLLGPEGVVPGSISAEPDSRQPAALDVLKVICTGRRVTVIGRDQERTTRVFASARWRAGQLERRTLSKGAPRLSPEQWTMIRNAIAEHVDYISADKLSPESPRSVLEVDEPTPLFKAMVWGGLGTFCLAIFFVQYTCKGDVEPDEPPPDVAAPEPIEARIMKAASFQDAFALAKPTMTGSETLSPGAMLFTRYAASKLRWEDVSVPAETTLGHAFEDPDAARGKRMCADGTIAGFGIQRRDLGPRRTYEGTLRVSDTQAIAFLAVGTLGVLTKDSKARFCGVIVGRWSAAIALVGMFDLPENRSPIVEQE